MGRGRAGVEAGKGSGAARCLARRGCGARAKVDEGARIGCTPAVGSPAHPPSSLNRPAGSRSASPQTPRLPTQTVDTGGRGRVSVCAHSCTSVPPKHAGRRAHRMPVAHQSSIPVHPANASAPVGPPPTTTKCSDCRMSSLLVPGSAASSNWFWICVRSSTLSLICRQGGGQGQW